MQMNEMLLEAMDGVDPALVRAARTMGGQKRRGARRRAITVLLAAVLTLALATTAYAYLSGADWFKSWFAKISDMELTPGQMEYIEEQTVDVGQSVTKNGWTVTVETAMADQNRAYIMLGIKAPAGTDLFAGEGTFFPDLDLISTDPAMGEYDIYIETAQRVEDGDGLNHTARLLCEAFIKTDIIDYSYPWVLTLGDFRTIAYIQNEPVETLHGEGPWSVEFYMTSPVAEEVELISEPMVCQGQRSRRLREEEKADHVEAAEENIVSVWEDQMMEDVWFVTEYVDILLTSFKLSPLGASCTYEYSGDDEGYPTLIAWDVQAVMKDGSAVAFEGGTGTLFYFPAPIDISEVDHIQLPNGYTIPMPELTN